jgi:hypothetical protein
MSRKPSLTQLICACESLEGKLEIAVYGAIAKPATDAQSARSKDAFRIAELWVQILSNSADTDLKIQDRLKDILANRMHEALLLKDGTFFRNLADAIDALLSHDTKPRNLALHQALIRAAIDERKGLRELKHASWPSRRRPKRWNCGSNWFGVDWRSFLNENSPQYSVRLAAKLAQDLPLEYH